MALVSPDFGYSKQNNTPQKILNLSSNEWSIHTEYFSFSSTNPLAYVKWTAIIIMIYIRADSKNVYIRFPLHSIGLIESIYF